MYAAEKLVRNNLYSDSHKYDKMNYNSHYGLIKLTPELWEVLSFSSNKDDTMLFTANTLTKQPWDEVMEKLNAFQLHYDNLVIAGGYVFSSLFGTRTTDIDLFIHGVSEERGLEIIEETFRDLECVKEGTRTKNTITYKVKLPDVLKYGSTVTENRKSFKVQFILRLYKQPHEIIHGFDVDCCGMLYDGCHVYTTQRCLRSLLDGYNTYNFDLMSPSYEYRLAKYGHRGMSVKIPKFTTRNIITEELERVYKLRFGHSVKKENILKLFFEEVPNFSSVSHWGLISYILDNIGSDFESIYKSLSWIYPGLVDIGLKYYSLLKMKCNRMGYELFRNMYHFDGIICTRRDSFNLNGLDLLLILERRLTDVQQNQFLIQTTVDSFISSVSDYDFYNSKGVDILSINAFLQNNTEGFKELWEGFIFKDDDLKCQMITNNVPVARKCEFFTQSYGHINKNPLVTVEPYVYELLSRCSDVKVPISAEFKTINPGEQATSTFHRIILDNRLSFYEESRFYEHDKYIIY